MSDPSASTLTLPPGRDLLVILGATASGKTRLAVAAAHLLRGEIVSADSRQVYRGLDLGSGKDLAEYGEVPHHLIDIVDPGFEFNLFAFQRQAFAAIEAIRGRGRLPIVAGGSGLYLEAVLKGYRLVEVPENPVLRAELAQCSDDQLRARLAALRPQQHNSTDSKDRLRLLRAIEIAVGESEQAPPPGPPIAALVVGIAWPREELRRRITARLRERLTLGLIDEVRRLHDERGVAWETLEFYGLEYRYVARHLRGELTHNDMVQQLTSAIHDFAKRQETWFRRMERQGTVIHWLDGRCDLPEQLRNILRPASKPV
jgi:tRNA dimethylallyltransferase